MTFRWLIHHQIPKTKSQILVTFSFTNWKMINESSKRHSKLLSLIFILNCLSKYSKFILWKHCPLSFWRIWYCQSLIFTNLISVYSLHAATCRFNVKHERTLLPGKLFNESNQVFIWTNSRNKALFCKM